MITDPFATAKDSTPPPRAADLIRGGRYRLPNRDGSHHPGGWMRVSNLVSAYADQYALREWEEQQIVKGLRADRGLYTAAVEAASTEVEDSEWLAWWLEACKRASGGSAGSDHGTMRHTEVEGLHRDAVDPMLPSESRRMLALYQSTLKRHKLTPLLGMQERRVLISSLGAVGTLDNIVNDLVADLKTQKKFWDFLHIGAQLACYAHGEAMWDPIIGVWVDMPPVRQDVALVLWMPRGGTTVDVLEVDIVAGWKTACRAYEVVQDRQDSKKGRAWLRPAPPVTEVEQYAAMFAGVDSHAEGRALVAECQRKGIWCEPLAESAQMAVDRLTKDVVR